MAYVVFFLAYVVNQYGWLPSISKSSDYLTTDGKEWMFFLFVWLLGFSFAWASKSMLGTFACALLPIIGTLTGWNPEIMNDKWEFGLHIFCTVSAIVLIMADMVRKKPVPGLPMVIIFFIFSLVALLEIKNYTYWIEVAAILITFIFYISIRGKKNKD
jgi:hypothetical protein